MSRTTSRAKRITLGHAFRAGIGAFLLISLSCCLPAAAEQKAAAPAPRVETLKTSDGIDLKISFFAAANPGPGVLLLHQCNQQRKMWDGVASQLAAAGINVLTLDFRGFGESGGPRFDPLKPQDAAKLQQKFPDDVDLAMAYLVTHPGVTHVIGAGGASCGVNEAIQLARRHTEVKSLVLLSGNTDRAGREFLRTATGLPIFFGVADDDNEGRVTAFMQWLDGIAPNPGNHFARFQTGGHGIEMINAHPEFAGAIVDWFVTTLLKTPGQAPPGAKRAMSASQISILEEIDTPGGAAKAAKALSNARAKDANAEIFPELLVNLLGYEHLTGNDAKGAIEIMKLNVAAYPKSANAYDSLADAYLADGQKDLARQNAQKSIDLLPADATLSDQRRKAVRESAEQKLK
jgi:dienelactone hydrolase